MHRLQTRGNEVADTYLRPLKDVDTIFAVSHKSRETFRAIVTDLGQVDT